MAALFLSPQSFPTRLPDAIRPEFILHVLVHEQNFICCHIGDINVGRDAVEDRRKALVRCLKFTIGFYQVGCALLNFNFQGHLSMIQGIFFFLQRYDNPFKLVIFRNQFTLGFFSQRLKSIGVGENNQEGRQKTYKELIFISCEKF